MNFQIQAVNWQERGDLIIEGNIKSGAGRVKVEVEKPDDDTVMELFKFLQPGELVKVSKFEESLSVDGVQKKDSPQFNEVDIEQSVSDEEKALDDMRDKDDSSDKKEEGEQEEKVSQVVKDFDPTQIGNVVKSRVEKKTDGEDQQVHDLNVVKPGVDFENNKFDESDFNKDKPTEKPAERIVYNDEGELEEAVGSQSQDDQEETDNEKPVWE